MPTPRRSAPTPLHLFTAIAAGKVKVVIGGRFPLEAAAEAHRTAESRMMTRAILLTRKGNGAGLPTKVAFVG